MIIFDSLFASLLRSGCRERGGRYNTIRVHNARQGHARSAGAPVSRDVTRRRGVVGWMRGKLGLARARLI